MVGVVEYFVTQRLPFVVIPHRQWRPGRTGRGNGRNGHYRQSQTTRHHFGGIQHRTAADADHHLPVIAADMRTALYFSFAAMCREQHTLRLRGSKRLRQEILRSH
ncbi:hypothetical protein SRABI106_03854 [Rahnella aquatilis]|nr:hypothetical protein SRABI106_03854 [Rahnella aquatilis]